MTDAYHRILLTRLKFIGDIVLTTPHIRTLRETFPDAYIAYLGDREAVRLLEGNPDLNEIIPIDLSRGGFFSRMSLFYTLRRRKFDLVIDLFANPRSALLTFATGARVRVGGDFQGRGKLYTVRIRDDGAPKTAIEFHYQSLRAVGIQPRSFETKVYLSDDERREARRYLEWQDVDFTKPVVALHPGGTWPSKLWGAERFAGLADLLRAKTGAQLILTQGPGDAETVKDTEHSIVGHLLTLPVLPLRQLAGILSQCSAFVTNDCGPMHLSVAVGTPTIGLFGPGEESIWFPYTERFPGGSKKHVALRRDVACHPCHLNACNRPGDENMECMKLLTVEDVFAAVRERL